VPATLEIPEANDPASETRKAAVWMAPAAAVRYEAPTQNSVQSQIAARTAALRDRALRKTVAIANERLQGARCSDSEGAKPFLGLI
jgi:hypothetical protein